MAKYYINITTQRVKSVQGWEWKNGKSKYKSIVERYGPMQNISGLVSEKLVNLIYKEIDTERVPLKHYVVYHGSEKIDLVCRPDLVEHKIQQIFGVECPYHLWRPASEVAIPRV